MDNLKYIRETMERATAFTGISGWGQVAIGFTALTSASISAQQKTFKAWLAVWMAEAVIALLIAGWSIDRKAWAARMPLLSGPGRKVAFSLSPPIFCRSDCDSGALSRRLNIRSRVFGCCFTVPA